MSSWASLPMYDFPELREANTQLWSALAQLFRDEGVENVPEMLSDGRLPQASDPNRELQFTQTCGYPLQTSFRDRLAVIAVPCYEAFGCKGPTHRSFIVVARSSPARTISDLHKTIFAVNAMDSNSGMNLPRRKFAPLAGSKPFFSDVILTGSHVASMHAVAGGDAYAASVDCVTFALYERHRPDVTDSLRILDTTAASPSPPFVTSAVNAPATISKIRHALARASCDRRCAQALHTLGIERITTLPQEAYDINLIYQFEARRMGYATLR